MSSRLVGVRIGRTGDRDRDGCRCVNVKVCVWLAELPQASVAVYVRLMVN